MFVKWKWKCNLLQARVDEDLLIYEAFPYYPVDSTVSDQRLKLRFKKYDHGLILKEQPHSRQHKKGEEDGEEKEKVILDTIQQLRVFDGVSGYSGVSNF